MQYFCTEFFLLPTGLKQCNAAVSLNLWGTPCWQGGSNGFNEADWRFWAQYLHAAVQYWDNVLLLALTEQKHRTVWHSTDMIWDLDVCTIFHSLGTEPLEVLSTVTDIHEQVRHFAVLWISINSKWWGKAVQNPLFLPKPKLSQH